MRLGASDGDDPKARATPLRALVRFWQDEAGVLTGFSLYIFILMMMIAGLTIDIMRYEAVRTRLQATSDRAVLAAADLDQTTDAVAVVEDYFEKAGMSDYLEGVQVAKGLNYKEVEARVSAEIPTWFMNMSGIDTLNAFARSKAEERIQNIEVSLVVDISGSMGSNSKIQNLRTAADKFVRTMMAANDNITEDGTGLTSVSIIPYHAVVNVPDYLLAKYNVSKQQEVTNCVRFAPSDFQSISLSTTDALDRLAHFDRNNSNLYTQNGDRKIGRPWCQIGDYGAILPLSTSLTDLTGKVASLGAGGNTATDLGMKWAAALLDPGSQDVVTDLIDEGHLDGALAGRPVAYEDTETIKVIVLMTDGENTSQYDLKNKFKGTMSPVWWDEDSDEFFVYFQNRADQNKQPWWDVGRTPESDTNGNDAKYGDGDWDPQIERPDARQLSHAELFGTFSVRYVSEYFFRVENDSQSSIRNDYRNAVTRYTGNSTADDYTEVLCDKLKAKDVVIFTIGFEAPARGQTLMKYCASSSGHYFDVKGVEISEAFSSIANTIQQLRLSL
ncbi:MAG: TadE/TadG family type IV pilus assembly protein [Pseudomonadota bacterium]